ncbi:hypothetical protein ACLJYM_22865 [Rhizobium giardinii]|uniref:hypothetical protein n=1 Tax=Rhizobium giardinii TaxID=56731 RepID=UPI0039DF3405
MQHTAFNMGIPIEVVCKLGLHLWHRYGAGQTWLSLRGLGIMAYRKIADLRTVCRESYDTHGLSLDPGRMRS